VGGGGVGGGGGGGGGRGGGAHGRRCPPCAPRARARPCCDPLRLAGRNAPYRPSRTPALQHELLHARIRGGSSPHGPAPFPYCPTAAGSEPPASHARRAAPIAPQPAAHLHTRLGLDDTLPRNGSHLPEMRGSGRMRATMQPGSLQTTPSTSEECQSLFSRFFDFLPGSAWLWWAAEGGRCPPW
jgi:hypothetical protein